MEMLKTLLANAVNAMAKPMSDKEREEFAKRFYWHGMISKTIKGGDKK